MLMSVVKLVVLATQENFDRERESKIGEQCAVSYSLSCSVDFQ